MKLIGFRRVDISREGAEVHGYNLYCTYQNGLIEGEVAERLWVNDRVMVNAGDLRVGCEVTPVYNKYGKIAALDID